MVELPEATVTVENGGIDGLFDVDERDESRRR